MFRTVHAALLSHQLVFVVKGSGGVADAFVRLYEASSTERRNEVVDRLVDENKTLFQSIKKALIRTVTLAKRRKNVVFLDYSADQQRREHARSMVSLLLSDSVRSSFSRATHHGETVEQGRSAMDPHYVTALNWMRVIPRLVRGERFDLLQDLLLDLKIRIAEQNNHAGYAQVLKYVFGVSLRTHTDNCADMDPVRRARADFLFNVYQSGVEHCSAALWIPREFIDLNELYSLRR